jgi:hypothetical protein
MKNPATFVKTCRFAGKQNRRPSASGAEAPARRQRARPRSVKARPSTLAASPKCSKPSSPTTASEAGASSPRPTEAAIGASRRERELVLVCASAVFGGSSRSGRFARKASLVPALPRRAGPNLAADVVPAQDEAQVRWRGGRRLQLPPRKAAVSDTPRETSGRRRGCRVMVGGVRGARARSR